MDPELINAEPPLPGPEPGRRSRTRRYLAAGALVAGGVTVGALFSPVGLAGAQSDDTTSSDEATTSDGGDEAEDGDGRGHHRGGHLLGLRQSLDDLAETLGLSTDELLDQLRDGASLAEVAEAEGVDVEELTSQLLDDLGARLDEAVADGDLDADKAEELRSTAEERIDELVNGELPLGRRGGRDGSGPGLGRGLGLSQLADELGITADDIRQGLADGKTAVEIAADAGVSEDELVSALVEAASERMDEAVENGRLDADEAAERKAELEEKITELVNTSPGDLGAALGVGPGGQRGDGFGGFGGRHGHGHRFRSDDDDAGDGSTDDSATDDTATDDEGETEGSSLTF